MPKFYFIRHGKTKGNEEKRYIGRSDEALSTLGREEILALREKDIPKAVEALFVSPMKRCRESASILFPDKEMFIVPDFREYDFGRFEGKNYQELLSEPSYVSWLDSGGAEPFPEGEGMPYFKERVTKAFEDVLRACTVLPEEAVCAFVVHGGTIMSIMEKYNASGGSYYDYQIPNGSFMCVSWDGKFPCRLYKV